jgi:hypothetical protein
MIAPHGRHDANLAVTIILDKMPHNPHRKLSLCDGSRRGVLTLLPHAGAGRVATGPGT